MNEPKQHTWVQGKDLGFKETSHLHNALVCKECGVLRRPDGGNGQCRGPIKVGLR